MKGRLQIHGSFRGDQDLVEGRWPCLGLLALGDVLGYSARRRPAKSGVYEKIATVTIRPTSR